MRTRSRILFALSPLMLASLALAAEDSSATLDTVVVSGSKRKLKQDEVPGTVSVVDGAALEREGARDQEDIFKLTPGVQLNKGDPNQAVPTIRGIGTASNGQMMGIQQATTGFYIEEVPFTDPFGFVSGADLAPFDLKHVEVMRGPQGALFGSASLGGAVSYVLNKPALKDFAFSALGSVDSVAEGGVGHAVHAMVNVPIMTDTAGLRIVAFDRHDAGWITNLGSGHEKANTLHQSGGRVIGTLKPSADATLTAMLLTQRTHSADTFAVSPDPDRLTTNAAGPAPRTSTFTLGNVRAEWTLPDALDGLELTSNTGYLDKHGLATSDGTRAYSKIGSLYGPLLGVGALPDLPSVRSLVPETRRSRAVSEELRIGNGGAGSNKTFQWLAGLFYQRTSFNTHGLVSAPGGEALWGPVGPLLLPSDVLASTDVIASTTEKAVFADTEWHFAPAWSLTLGGRWYRTTLDLDARASFLGGPVAATAGITEHGFTPKAALKYQFGQHMAYVLASKGYRFGGVNINPPALSPYKSDSLWNYEAGLRLVPAKGLRADLTVFRLDWKDAQVSAVLPGAVPIVGVANVGQARSQGLEAALQWRAAPGLNLAAALAWTDAETTAPYTNSSGIVIAAGSRLPGTARLQGSLQASYDFEGPADTSGRLSATQSHTGPRVFEIEGTTRAPGYSQTDLRASLGRGAWEATLSLTNAFDKRGINGAAGVSLPGVTAYTDYYLIRPRTIGFSLRYDL
ncbi:TonB-dependent receptor [Pelomonas sp. KK5]|uniref:TonB-dependent receptor n=1 Tax=Pelomonas sp. KK5 TaxID=1855730 RepID=UPI00097C416A|nr:TonB-dependent receptor [Pelomonas sp. KK5]